MSDTYQTRPLSDGVGVALSGVQISKRIDHETINLFMNLLYRHSDSSDHVYLSRIESCTACRYAVGRRRRSKRKSRLQFPQRLQYLLRRNRQFGYPDADGVVYRIGNGRGGDDQAHLGHALGAERSGRLF